MADDAALREVLEGFRIVDGHRPLAELRSEINLKARIVGMLACNAAESDFRYDELARQLNGTLANPQRPTTERNALQAGVDTQFSFGASEPFEFQLFGLRPYFQTDFRGAADIYGVSALYETYAPDLRLGVRKVVPGEKNLVA